MATTLHFVRHGATQCNENGVFMGLLDAPLSRTGIEQALALRQTVRNLKLDRAIASPLARAHQTALLALGYADSSGGSTTQAELALVKPTDVERHIPLSVDLRLAERSFGDLQGQAKRDYTTRFPQYAGRQVTKSSDDKPDGGESFAELDQRVGAFLDEAIRIHHRQSLLIVTHHGPIRIAHRYFRGLTWEETLRVHCDNGELVTFERP